MECRESANWLISYGESHADRFFIIGYGAGAGAWHREIGQLVNWRVREIS